MHYYQYVVEERALHGTWVNRISMHADPVLTEADAAKHLTLTLAHLPQYGEMSVISYRDLIK